MSPEIVLASTNLDKFQEMRALFARYPELQLVKADSVLRNAEKIGMVEIYSSYAENAAAKARLVNQGCHFPSLADDSGLEVFALDGKPGVRSARFASLEGKPSKLSQDQANVEKLLTDLKGAANREARFVCTLVLVIEGMSLSATGTLEGMITDTPRGEMGFGYDPVFVPKGETRTLAEMTETEKNAISHRAHALQNLMQEIASHGIQFAKP
ncbi:MAG: RdgB/HAM1 family non-canonical purine NTP pyrophosphatase [Cryobacterium sp.]|nr:RdgB/HAM1 family non-canonical purine NTP pyrophosphatase [Oligoflexia bacterium]